MKHLTIILLLFISHYVEAQSDSIKFAKKSIWNNASIIGEFQKGWVFPTNDFFKYHNVEPAELGEFQHFSLKYSKQTTGTELWEQLYKYPNWGFGVSVIDFYNPTQIGVPFAFYGFMNAPFVRWNKISFNYELSFGPSFNWKAYNPINNKYNVSIGAGEAFFIDAGLNLDFELDSHIDLITGFSLTHYSNGALKIPNSGINSFAPKVSLKYSMNERPKFLKRNIPKFIPQNELLISTFIGAKNLVFKDSVSSDVIEQYEGVLYPIIGVSATFNHQISYKSKIGFGVNLAYNTSANAKPILDNNSQPFSGNMGDKIQISIFPSYELMVNKVSLILQPAFYIYRKKADNMTPVFHQRIGLKYYVADDVFVGITLRDYAFHVSDFIEWNVGYRIGN